VACRKELEKLNMRLNKFGEIEDDMVEVRLPMVSDGSHQES
jgi:hypothetical protein